MYIKLKIYRYNPNNNSKPYFQNIKYIIKNKNIMLLNILLKIKNNIDNTLAIRKSCREGVCGSDAMNINGINSLACITNIKNLKQPIIIRPLPGFNVIKDLIVDMKSFFEKYYYIKPYLINKNKKKIKKEFIQSIKDRKKINNTYECILCGCCTSSCPSFWWNSNKFIGPAGLLQAYRFIIDNRDENYFNRINKLNNSYLLFKCKSIMNCIINCPKKLNPNKAIVKIKNIIFKKKIYG